MSKSIEELLRDIQIDDGPRPGPVATANGSRRPAGLRQRASATSSLMVIIAIILVAVVGSLPFISLALYPFALLVTLIHETGHAMAGIGTGGTVIQLRISPNLSGVTLTSGGLLPVIASAGYLGATAAGMALLLTPLCYARLVLGVLALVPLAALLAFHPGTLFTALWCLLFAGALGAAAWRLSLRLAAFLQIFLGVEAGLNAFRDLMTLLLISNGPVHIRTDAQTMSNALFLPPIFWAVTWTLISGALISTTLLLVLRRDVRALSRT